MDISIIITTYNTQQFISATLHSVAQQTYKNFEIVIVDDGSTDNTLQLVNDFKKTNPDLIVNVYPLKHVGRGPALNYGLSVALFDWIAILDADDLWVNSKLEMQVKFIQKFNLSFLATKSKIFHHENEININQLIQSNYTETDLNEITLSNMLITNHISHSSIMTKKSLLCYNETRKSQIDYEMWLRLLQEGVSLHMLAFPLIYHRIHPGQSFESKNPFKYALRAARLQLQFCFYNLKPIQALFVILKVGYYALIPRNIRLLLREMIF